MTSGIAYAVSTATAEQIAGHLRGCDEDFVTQLAAKVDIAAYSRKIETHAQRFEAWTEGGLMGLVAAYCNNFQDREAFITSVSVAPEWQGRGLGSELVTRCVTHARSAGFLRIRLEVWRDDAAAIAFYRKNGFGLDPPDGAATTMTLNI